MTGAFDVYAKKEASWYTQKRERERRSRARCMCNFTLARKILSRIRSSLPAIHLFPLSSFPRFYLPSVYGKGYAGSTNNVNTLCIHAHCQIGFTFYPYNYDSRVSSQCRWSFQMFHIIHTHASVQPLSAPMKIPFSYTRCMNKSRSRNLPRTNEGLRLISKIQSIRCLVEWKFRRMEIARVKRTRQR